MTERTNFHIDEDVVTAILTETEYMTHRDVAECFDLSVSAVRQIRSGRRHKKVYDRLKKEGKLRPARNSVHANLMTGELTGAEAPALDEEAEDLL